MDDIAHEPPRNHRKRKAPNDDPQDPSDDPVVENINILADPVADQNNINSGPPTAPRQSWLAAEPMWPTSLAFRPSPQKRPRVQKRESRRENSYGPPARRLAKRACMRPPRSPPHPRLGNDLEDIGIVSTSDPGPSSGSLLHLRDTVFTKSIPPSTISSVPIDPNSTHIPPVHPPINRNTLKELDLDVIIRNPQLRHDLLFDPGLQFRPTTTRRKTERSEKYWAAITCELESGCTCVSFDMRGKPHPTVCACAHVSTPSLNPVVAFSPTLHVVTLRMPSRIRSLLDEFLEVLLLVIQPLSNVVGAHVSPTKSQQAEHVAQAAYIRSVFDPALIEQELKHKLFDPSGLFRAIGLTLQGHCAPMRDHAVELMVQVAQTCAPGGEGTKADAVRAVRMCMDILELMKLDIANHQLQTLRPFLMRTSGQFELRSFKSRKGGQGCPFQKTREWLAAAHSTLLARGEPIPHPLYPPGHLRYQTLQKNQQIYLATLKGLTDLVFTSPSPANLISLPVATPPTPQATLPTISSLPGYPETSYLDNARILLLSTDAVDLTALYMFLLLYRQLRFSGSAELPSSSSGGVDEWELQRIKREIRDIGSSRLGYSFYCGSAAAETDVDTEELEKWRALKQSVVLQIAMRAKNVSTTDQPIGPVDESLLGLAQRWADQNIQYASVLSTMLRERLRDVVFNAVVALAYPGRDAASGKLANIDFSTLRRSPLPSPSPSPAVGKVTGMEALTEEIGALAENISRLALIHINAYLPLYEVEHFLDA
ncbi:T-complex protein 11-domain-containing protein [Mycena metata]|uniref:T-complex protein 11-domain-containing protein n=1 Tax=Mycena metata TaxID=1033252 RepID=A0AAD7KFK3_9AGAR|nr:T-complex protein 11-domain-containing protein [Mycena metata]